MVGLSGRNLLGFHKDGYTFERDSVSANGPGQTEIVGGYTVSGRITDGSGTGIEGVEVSFNGVHGSVVTDSQGYWRKSSLGKRVVVRPVLAEHTFEPSSREVERTTMATDFVGAPLPPRLVDIFIFPEDATIYLGEEIELWAIGVDQYGEDYQVSPKWHLQEGDGSFTEDEGNRTTFCGIDVGTVVLEATMDGIVAQTKAAISYAPAVLTELSIVSSRSRIKTNEEASLHVRGVDQYGREMPVEASWRITWNNAPYTSRTGGSRGYGHGRRCLHY